MPDENARIVAELMAEADLNGSDGHGIFRLPSYIRRIREGGINLTPDIHIVQEKSGMALVTRANERIELKAQGWNPMKG